MPKTPTRITPADALKTLVAIHALLHPELYDEGADPIDWSAETIEAVDEIVCDAMEQLDQGAPPRGS
jgi:hypothetical protein